MTSRKPSSIFNTSFSDEIAPPKKFRVKREEKTARTPSRSMSRSLSPGKLRNSMTAASPLLSPMMKNLLRISRPRRASEGPAVDDEEDETSSLMPIEPTLSSDMKDSNDFAFEVLEHPKRRHLKDNKGLMPPSGRVLGPDDDQDCTPDCTKPASASSSTSSKPPSGRVTPETIPAAHRPATPPNKSASLSSGSASASASASSSSNKPPSAKPSSWSSTTGTGKPPSSSSTGSADSSSFPPRPRRSQRPSDETTPTHPQTTPRRTRSATPSERIPTRSSSPQTRKNSTSKRDTESATRTAEDKTTTATDTIITKLPLSTKPQLHPEESKEQKIINQLSNPNPLSGDKSRRSNSLFVNRTGTSIDDKSVPKSSQEASVLLEHREKQRHSYPKDKTASINDTEPTPIKAKKTSATRATPEQRELLHRIRSKSKEQSPASTIELTNRTTSEQREKSARRARSRSRDKSNPIESEVVLEEKSLRRGRKKTVMNAESSKPATKEDAIKPNGHKQSIRRQHSSQKTQPDPGVSGETATATEQYHDSQTGEEKEEKPDSARRLEIQRKNLDKETLAQVKNLKEEIKQMRNHRRKVKFGEKGSTAATPLPADGMNPLQQAHHHQKQQQQPQLHPISPFRLKSPSVSKSRLQNIHMSPKITIPQSPFHNSASTAKSDFNTSKSTLYSSKATSDFNSSIGAISFEDLDVAYMKAPPPLLSEEYQLSEEEHRLVALQKQIKKTKKLIKRTTRDVWTEREEIITLQRKNWSIRKALMQHEGPPDSLTTLNMKIEKMLRQDRELDMETDQFHEQKELVDSECGCMAKKIGKYKDLFDKLHKIIVPLLPLPEDPPQQIGPSESATEPISPLPSPSGTNRQAVSVALPRAPDMDDIEDLSLHSSQNDEDDHKHVGNEEEEEEGSLSISHLQMTASWA